MASAEYFEASGLRTSAGDLSGIIDSIQMARGQSEQDPQGIPPPHLMDE